MPLIKQHIPAIETIDPAPMHSPPDVLPVRVGTGPEAVLHHVEVLREAFVSAIAQDEPATTKVALRLSASANTW